MTAVEYRLTVPIGSQHTDVVECGHTPDSQSPIVLGEIRPGRWTTTWLGFHRTLARRLDDSIFKPGWTELCGTPSPGSRIGRSKLDLRPVLGLRHEPREELR